MKKLVLFLLSLFPLSLLLLLTTACGAAPSAEAPPDGPSLTTSVAAVDEHGSVYLTAAAQELYDAGCALGDTLQLTMGEDSLSLPLVSAYADVDAGQPLLRDKTGLLVAAYNQDSFLAHYPLAVGDTVIISLQESGGYLAEYQRRHPVYTSEREPDYSDAGAWAYYGEGESERDFDVFLIAPTVDLGESGNLNTSLDDSQQLARMVSALNQQRGLYEQDCALWSPYYRQATMAAWDEKGQEDAASITLAYQDISAAFAYYLQALDDGEPLLLAGFSQGAHLALLLLQEYGPQLEGRLVAAYLPGWRVTEADLREWVVPAAGETDTGVFICFNSEADFVSDSITVPAGLKSYCINPLNWRTDSTPADKSLNLGACFPDGDGNISQELPGLTGAYIDEHRGTLKLTDIDPADYPPTLSVLGEGVYHLYDCLFFYRNLQANVSARCRAYTLAEQ